MHALTLGHVKVPPGSVADPHRSGGIMKVRGLLVMLALSVVAASASAQAPASKQGPGKSAVKPDTGKKETKGKSADAKGTKGKSADSKGKAKGAEKKDTTKAASAKKP
jgi:hypothetical protein